MKIMVASDIHGSAFWCQKMVKAFEHEHADRLLLLGDILYHGPRNELPEKYSPKDVIAMLNPLKQYIFCVRGNCDSEVDQIVLEFPILADYCIVSLKNTIIYATHGHIFNKTNMPQIQTKDILLHGHTHIPAWENVCISSDNHKNSLEYLYINPGSVSIPKNGSSNSYIILDDTMQNNGTIFWKDFNDNIFHSVIL